MRENNFNVIGKKNLKEGDVFDLGCEMPKPPVVQSPYGSNQSSSEMIKKIKETNLSYENLAHSMLSATAEYHDSRKKQEELKQEGIRANIETRDQLIEQNELLSKQLTEQTEINQRLEHEFKMGAREAVITRRIAYWSLGVGIVGVIIAIISLFRG